MRISPRHRPAAVRLPAEAQADRLAELRARLDPALGLDLVPGTGLLAACVPGAFGAWMLLLAEHVGWLARHWAGRFDHGWFLRR